MKKYLLTLAAIMLATTALAMPRGIVRLDAQTVKKIAPEKADAQTWKNIGEGQFSDFVLSNLFKQYVNDPVDVQYQESEQTPGLYRIINPWKEAKGDKFDESLNYLIIDATDPDYVMIPEQRAPIDDPVEGEIWYCSYTYFMYVVKGIDKEVFINVDNENAKLYENYKRRVPVLKDGVINFSSNSVAVKYPYYTGTEFDPEDWTYSNMESDGYVKLPGATSDAGEWKSIGKGLFRDGFVETLFDENYVPVETEVEIMKNIKTEGVYKVVKAFGHSAETGRDMVVDASDPGFVRVRHQNTGVKTDRGWLYIMSASCNGTFANYDEMVALMPDYEDRNITMTDNKILFPVNSMFLKFPDEDEVYVYTNPNAKESYIILPSTEGVDYITSDQDMPEIYYNLQGMRVSNPESGQIVVVRKGLKTYKEIIR